MTGLRRAQIRGFEGLTVDEVSSALAGTATPSAIDPDDAAVVGTSTLYARQDHQHAIAANAPDALVLQSFNAEGTSASFARADHDHATSVLPWGFVVGQEITSNSSGFTASGATDFALNSFAVNTTRRYRVWCLTQWSITGGVGVWTVDFAVGGVAVDRFDVLESESAGQFQGFVASNVLWTPGAGTVNLTVTVTEVVGTSTLTLQGGATNIRRFYVEDVGPR